MQHVIKTNSKLILSLVLIATLGRIAILPFLGHPPNFSPIDSIALFCGAYFYRRSMAFTVVLLSVWIGDFLLSRFYLGHWSLFYTGWYWQYLSYMIITLLGVTLRNNVTALRVLGTCLISASLFFIISNFGVWWSGLLYPRTLDGLMTCYIAAIPFFKNTVISDLVFTSLFFGIVAAVNTKKAKVIFRPI